MLALEHELFLGEVVLKELRRVLRTRFKVSAGDVSEIEAFLRTFTVVPKPREHLHLGIRDADDECIVASAVAAGVDLVVSGDTDLRDSTTRLPIPVVTPRELWKMLRNSIA